MWRQQHVAWRAVHGHAVTKLTPLSHNPSLSRCKRTIHKTMTLVDVSLRHLAVGGESTDTEAYKANPVYAQRPASLTAFLYNQF